MPQTPHRQMSGTAEPDPERNKLATYLGARTSHRFERQTPERQNIRTWRIRFILAAAAFLLLGLWGIWLEFCA